MRRKLFIWDLDDTLVDNVHDYSDSILDATRLVISQLGAKAPHVAAIIKLQEDLDRERVREINPDTGKPFGYTMERFPGTLAENYLRICEKAGEKPLARVAEEMKRIGMMAFDKARYRANIKPDAIRILSMTNEHGHANVLLTKGDPRVQQAKVDALLGVAKKDPFTEIVIVETTKDPAIFLQIGEMHAAPNWDVYAVGNDYNKDVLPALNAHQTFRGVWIPVQTWEMLAPGYMEKVTAEVDRERCEVMDHLGGMTALL